LVCERKTARGFYRILFIFIFYFVLFYFIFIYYLLNLFTKKIIKNKFDVLKNQHGNRKVQR